MRHFSDWGFADPENVKRYSEGSPAFFFPGLSVMHQIAAQLIAESMGSDGHALVLGAGGGLEMRVFADTDPGWRLTGVDPAPEMLKVAAENLADAADRITWVEAYIPDAPEGPFDAATCLLTLHLIPDDGHKIEALKAIHSRLKPGARFVIVDNCFDRDRPDFETKLARYLDQAKRRGVPEDLLEKVGEGVRTMTESVTDEREVELLRQAGFKEIELIYAALSWRGWVAIA